MPALPIPALGFTIQERAAKQSTAARTATAAVITSMLELGTPKVKVADRLGLALRDIKKSPIA
ncbi:hypothetical protein [Cryobacterium gelidum]|jgi:hypothetical protein|uniref:Uncharacterized protein n=1 Tax=Cryobacterium gelidum TaxID=1259164 RepID=A0A4R9AZY5_9MICO|nr:hypothetical protein [Cryobacterium gelidum]TFD72730.1 hypothetical protein E3T50_05295 [Cryobacterium gelidum]